MTKKKAIVLFSGGLDSTTCLAWGQNEGFTCHAMSFDYGQKHNVELEAAKRLGKHFNVASHNIVPLSPALFQTSSLVNPKRSIPEDAHNPNVVPSTYVPARNTIFLSMALALAETLEASAIIIGVSAVDYSNYPDCRPEYIKAFQAMANLATAEDFSVQILTPLIDLSKAQTIQLGHTLGVDYSQTISCYQANEKGEACGKCDSCYLRKKGFLDAGVADPTHYQP